jgi:hypothetical protein
MKSQAVDDLVDRLALRAKRDLDETRSSAATVATARAIVVSNCMDER